jgi:hypothetical protein
MLARASSTPPARPRSSQLLDQPSSVGLDDPRWGEVIAEEILVTGSSMLELSANGHGLEQMLQLLRVADQPDGGDSIVL